MSNANTLKIIAKFNEINSDYKKLASLYAIYSNKVKSKRGKVKAFSQIAIKR